MNKKCAIYVASNLIGKRWTILILQELYKGNNPWKRYNELKSKVPEITSKMLSVRLKELEKEGIISKQVDSSVIPIKSEYSLTKCGEECIDVIKHIKTWSLKHTENKVCKSQSCKGCEF